MSLTYTTFVTSLANELAISLTDANYIAMLPVFIDYTELRIQRDLDLLTTITSDATTVLTAGSRTYSPPAAFEVIQQLNVITPVSASVSTGTKIPLTPVPKEFLDAVYSNATIQDVPQYFAMINTSTISIGPVPDQSYPVEVVGTQRVIPLSPSNSTNYLSTNLPDLYLAGAMISASGWMRNYGSQADTPQMAQSWENQYQTLLKSATVEEFRKKFQASAWSSMSPAVVASPTR
jgi:hypothetical protein